MIKKIKADDAFREMVKELGRIPRLDEFLQTGFKKTAYYDARKRFTSKEEEVK